MINKVPFNFIFVPNITDDFGRFINHSYKSNSYLYYNKKNNIYYLKSSKNINKNTEITTNY